MWRYRRVRGKWGIHIAGRIHGARGGSRAAGHSHIKSALGLCHPGLGYIEVLML